jgi:CheY-like chemotaxis protein
MNLIQNMSIKQRLITILFIWVSIFICFGIFAVIEATNLGNVTKSVYEHPFQVSAAAKDVRLDLNKIQRSLEDIVSSGNETEIRISSEKLKAIEQNINENLDIIKNYTIVEQSRELEKQAEEMFMQCDEDSQVVIDDMLKGNVQQAANIIKEIEAVNIDKLGELLIQIEDNARSKADEFLKEAESIGNSQRTVLVSVIILVSSISFILFITVINGILKPINALNTAMRTGTDTGKLMSVNIKGKNEIVEMSNFYNTLVNKLKDMFWAKDTQNDLSQDLSGCISIEELTEKAVNFLSRVVNAGKGILYIYDKESSILHLKAAFAFTESDKLYENLSLGEGIIGQVALQRKPIFQKNISKTENYISTGVIDEAPLNTYTFPLIYEKELYGVIALASFEPYDKTRLEFLNESSNIIAANLYSSFQNQNIKHLLQVSEEAREDVRKSAEELKDANAALQEQQELLQQQSEEIQQTNTELEEQQQLLQQQSEELHQTNLLLEEQQQQLEEQARLLSIDNKNLEIIKDELIERSDALELINRYKSEFLANMSHELRTPLNSIILLSKLLTSKANARFDSKDLEKINIINKSGQELLRLINDILDLSKIEAGRVNLEVVDFHSNSLLDEIRNMFEGAAKEKSLKLELEDLVSGRLRGDQHKISQILRNFISNAIKFTEKGSVILKIMPDQGAKDGVIVLVKDTGTGIAKEQQAIIFEEFRQGDSTITRKHGGTGLGLSISKKLSDLMGAEIKVKSEIGVGSEFYLYIPNLISAADGDYDIRQKVLSDKGDESFDEASAAASMNNEDRAILIIEDDKEFSKYVANIIRGMGFMPLIAFTGKNGLRLAGEYKPHGILLDLGLPDISGMDVLRELKSTNELRKIPVHIISVRDKDNKAQKAGAKGYSQKPLEESDVVGIVSEMLAFSENTPKKLLLIEDNRVQQEAIKELIGNGYIVVNTVDTEEAAKQKIAHGNYDAVILDLALKEGNGFNVCRFIGENNIEIPVIVYTGRDLSLDQEKEIRRYADSIIIKTANSSERLLDEVTLFLHRVKKNQKDQYYLYSKTNEEYALNLTGNTILIVDDDPRNIFVLASALEDCGASIIEADSGKTALQKLNEQKADLILMDIMMPETDGYRTIKAIREMPELKDIPIIAVTAKALKEDREKCIEAGANDYISKPVDYNTLKHLVKVWIEKS